MSSWSERVVGELHATLGELSSDVSKGRGEACGVWPNTEPPHPATHQAPQVWRAPEGPEGTGGLRGAAPNEVRPPSLAGGRVIPSAARLEAAARPAGPGCGARGRWRGLAGLRGAAPNEVRPPSLAGGQASRRPEIRRRRNQTNAIRQKSGGPQENLGTTTRAFTDVN